MNRQEEAIETLLNLINEISNDDKKIFVSIEVKETKREKETTLKVTEEK